MELTKQSGSSIRRRWPLTVVVALVFLTLPVLFIAVNVLEYELGIPIKWNPFDAIYGGDGSSMLTNLMDGLIVSGPILGLAALFAPLARARWNSDSDGFAFTVTIHKTTGVHLAFIVLCVLTIAVLGTYVIAENLPCLLSQQTIC